MDVKTCIQTRRSVRQFQNKPIARSLISDAVSLAQMAPSWRNSQTVRYIYIDDPVLKNRIAEQATLGFQKNINNISGAPGLFVITTEHSSPKGEYWEAFDSGLAVQTLCLALHDLGLGSVIMGLFDPALVAELTDVPATQQVSCLLAVGYPAEAEHGNSSRNSLNEILSYR